jgi:hypothetical protein
MSLLIRQSKQRFSHTFFFHGYAHFPLQGQGAIGKATPEGQATKNECSKGYVEINLFPDFAL